MILPKNPTRANWRRLVEFDCRLAGLALAAALAPHYDSAEYDAMWRRISRRLDEIESEWMWDTRWHFRADIMNFDPDIHDARAYLLHQFESAADRRGSVAGRAAK